MRPLTQAQRATQLEQLEQLTLAATMTASKLLAHDLAKLARGEAAPDAKQLTLAIHRLQLVLGWVQGEVAR